MTRIEAFMEQYADEFKELMEQYTINRAKWIAHYGSDEGYDAWFTKQITG